MIQVDYLKAMLRMLGFESTQQIWHKRFADSAAELKVDFERQQLIYPEAQGLIVNARQTCNFSATENAVVFECVHRLLEKGYKPEHIELEPKWKLGHGASGGRADILLRDHQGQPLLIIECKTDGKEFEKAWKNTQEDGGQLFSYIEQEKATQFVCLYASLFNADSQSISLSQKIISVKDNPKILLDNPKLASFAAANNNKERFRVWKETYQLEATETGLFEDNIQPYQIGKDKYTLLQDTKVIGAIDIKGAYHRFRTILRKHNVSRRENAFEVLVNLFLCKIVDELEHPEDLKFYWKGIAYDNYFDLVDRLQLLYKTGMERFLNQDIVYVSNEDINDAFWAIKQKPNATEMRVKELFRELKFYKGLDFEFIKVFNKAYFNKNAKILLEIIQMWQGLRLTGSEQNQFLGDMFEYFLDNGIKQTEGQFFTPVPICKFIVSALPLEQLIESHSEPIRVIDYACGSGHFLTEYAQQIPDLVRHIKHIDDPSPYYQGVYGIEKEDRLAKVAKVSAFMYGRKEVNIIDADALVPHAEIREAGFQVLIANPPFAVEDFLLTIDDDARARYTLMDKINDDGNRNIQCFFLERAKQLLAGDGVMGVIVPSSILSNADAVHVATREILLQYFDFVAITELGNRTFGKTGTNTVVLFLRRKAKRPEPAEHYRYRIGNFFTDWQNEVAGNGGAYLDVAIVQQYCVHIGLSYLDYQSLLLGDANTALLKTDIFKDYWAAFEAENEIKKLKLNKIFRQKNEIEQQIELQKRFNVYARAVEQDKLYYFMLAFHNACPVILVKSPADNKEQKQFLGYEWSGAKGSEGVIYNGGDTVDQISTPMFDPKNRDNESKISYLIRQNFLGEKFYVSEQLQPFVSQTNLVDLLDFSRKSFDKSFLLTVKEVNVVVSRWPMVKLGELAEIQSGGTPDSNNSLYWDGDIFWATLVDTKKKYLESTARKITELGLKNSSAKILPINTVIFSSRATIGEVTIAKVPTATNQGYKNFICDDSKINFKFLYEILKLFSKDIADLSNGMTFKEISKSTISNFRIPLPPLDIQQKIVDECEAVDYLFSAAEKDVVVFKKMIEDFLESSSGGAFKRISDVCEMKAGKFIPAKDIDDVFLDGLYPCFGGNGLRGYTRDFNHEGVYVLIGRQGALCGNVHLTQNQKFYATEHAIVAQSNENINKKWLYYKLISMNLNQYSSGVAQPGLSIQTIKSLQISIPPLADQEALVAQIEAIEAKIAEAQAVLDAAPAQKQTILNKYL